MGTRLARALMEETRLDGESVLAEQILFSAFWQTTPDNDVTDFDLDPRRSRRRGMSPDARSTR